jgi:GNAT superfamily N-acetyltransferase
MVINILKLVNPMTLAWHKPRLEIRPTKLPEIIALREVVIIRGTGRSNPEFEGDLDASTLHMGAFAGNRNVGCATFLMSQWDGEPAWQLRGMATAPDVRGAGVGAALLAEAESVLRNRGPIRLLWCNARYVALGFYQKQGWTIASDEFVTPGVGIQRKMTRRF